MYLLNMWLLSISCNTVVSNQIKIHKSEENIDTLTQAAAEIASMSFKPEVTTCVMIDRISNQFDIAHFVNKYRGGVMIFSQKMRMRPDQEDPYKQFVFYVDTSRDVEYLISFVGRKELFNNSGKFIVICYSNCHLTELFQMCWSKHVANVIVLKWIAGRVHIYTYYPYGPGWCDKIKPSKLFEWKSNTSFLLPTEPYPKKFHNLYGCRLIMSTFHQPPFITMEIETQTGQTIIGGTDGILVQLLAQHLNFKIDAIVPRDGNGWGYFNGVNWTGSLGDLSEGIVNISLTAAVATAQRLTTFQASQSYKNTQVVWVAPPNNKAPIWMKLLHTTVNPTGIIFCMTYILALLSLYFFQKRAVARQLLAMRRIPNDLMLKSWAMVTGIPVAGTPKTVFAYYIVVLWLWFCFFIRNSYQSILLSALKEDITWSSFSTLEGAIEQGFEYGGSVTFRDTLADDYELFKNYKVLEMNEIYNKLSDIADDKSKFLLLTNLGMLAQHCNTAHIHALNIRQESVISVPCVIYMRRFSPLTESINHVLQKISQVGIIEDDTVLENRITPWLKEGNQDMYSLTKLDLMFYFHVLIAGWVISFIAFSVEFTYSKVELSWFHVWKHNICRLFNRFFFYIIRKKR